MPIVAQLTCHDTGTDLSRTHRILSICCVVGSVLRICLLGSPIFICIMTGTSTIGARSPLPSGTSLGVIWLGPDGLERFITFGLD